MVNGRYMLGSKLGAAVYRVFCKGYSLMTIGMGPPAPPQKKNQKQQTNRLLPKQFLFLPPQKKPKPKNKQTGFSQNKFCLVPCQHRRRVALVRTDVWRLLAEVAAPGSTYEARCRCTGPWSNHPLDLGQGWSFHVAVAQKTGTKNGTLVRENMDQHLRNPSCLILSHTHVFLRVRLPGWLKGKPQGKPLFVSPPMGYFGTF